MIPRSRRPERHGCDREARGRRLHQASSPRTRPAIPSTSGTVIGIGSRRGPDAQGRRAGHADRRRRRRRDRLVDQRDDRAGQRARAVRDRPDRGERAEQRSTGFDVEVDYFNVPVRGRKRRPRHGSEPAGEPGTGGPRRDDHAQGRRGARRAPGRRTHRRRTHRRRTHRRPTHRRPTRRRRTRRTTDPPTTAPADDDDGRGDPPRPSDHTEVPTMSNHAALWGTQTELAIGNFPIAHRPLDVRVAHALAAIKRHAAVANAALGVAGVDAAVANAIGDAATRIERGELDDAVPGRRLPDRLGHVDEHERQRGHRPPGVGRAGPCGPPERSRQRVAVVERRRPDGDPPGRDPRAHRTDPPGARPPHSVTAGAQRTHRDRGEGRAHAPDGRHTRHGRVRRPTRGPACSNAALGTVRSPTSAPSASCRSAAPPSAPGSMRPTASPPRWSRRWPPRPGSRCARRRTRWCTRAARARSARRRAACAPSPWR